MTFEELDMELRNLVEYPQAEDSYLKFMKLSVERFRMMDEEMRSLRNHIEILEGVRDDV